MAIKSLVFAFALGAAPALPVHASADRSEKVTIDGQRYRVAIQGDQFVVFSKAVLVKYDLEERDRQRRAVEAATGCKIADELFDLAARLRGKVTC